SDDFFGREERLQSSFAIEGAQPIVQLRVGARKVSIQGSIRDVGQYQLGARTRQRDVEQSLILLVLLLLERRLFQVARRFSNRKAPLVSVVIDADPIAPVACEKSSVESYDVGFESFALVDRHDLHGVAIVLGALHIRIVTRRRGSPRDEAVEEFDYFRERDSVPGCILS